MRFGRIVIALRFLIEHDLRANAFAFVAWKTASHFSGSCCNAPALLLEHLLHLPHEVVDVRLVDDLAGNNDDAVGGNARFITLDILRHQLHALIAPLERLLHDGTDDAAFLDAAERDRILVETDDLDLVELAGFFQHLVNAWGVVGVEADAAAYIGHGGESVLHIALDACLIDLVAAHVDKLDLRAL